jgi:serine/threonine protein kinase
MEVLRKNAGVDLLKIRGEGSEGAVVEVQSGRSQPFVVKIGKQQYDEARRLGGLSQAATMHRMSRHPNMVSMKLNTDLGWSTALLWASGQYVAAVAMECADTDAHQMWADFRKRFKNQEDTELLPDVRSFSKGTIQVAGWMHGMGLAHGDLKPANILLKLLDCAPENPHVAFCVVQGRIFQIVLGDLGHARWSGQGMNATHVFTKQKHGCRTHALPLDFPSGKCLRDSIVVVETSVCSQAFGHWAKVEHSLEHPGSGTVTIRAPDYNRCFKAGEGADQRSFDQSADMWAVGIMDLRILALPNSDKAGQQPLSRDADWAEGIRKASHIAEKRLLSLNAGLSSKRGANSLSGVLDARDRGSWIAKIVREKNQHDSWPLLDGRLSGQEKSAWASLLDLLEGLLRYTSEHRLTADRALRHRFFSAPNTPP